LPPLALTPQPPIDIQSSSFDTGNPQTWGLAPTGRRIFALAVYKERLYYSVAQGPQVWSAQIGSSGALNGSTARVEVEVPSLGDGEEIASIAFDSQGRMYLAGRGPTTGDYQLTQLARGGTNRVLRYTQKVEGDPSPGLWTFTPEVYSVGWPSAIAAPRTGSWTPVHAARCGRQATVSSTRQMDRPASQT
jgi:hypothetical protein